MKNNILLTSSSSVFNNITLKDKIFNTEKNKTDKNYKYIQLLANRKTFAGISQEHVLSEETIHTRLDYLLSKGAVKPINFACKDELSSDKSDVVKKKKNKKVNVMPSFRTSDIKLFEEFLKEAKEKHPDSKSIILDPYEMLVRIFNSRTSTDQFAKKKKTIHKERFRAG